MNPEAEPEHGALGATTELFKAEWSELGPIGRLALIALVVSAAIAVSLAVAIPRQVEGFLVASDVESLQRVVADVAGTGLIVDGPASMSDLDELGEAVERRLIGRETVRVKLWAPDGTILYSDERGLIGQRFELSSELVAALAGGTQIGTPDLTRPENAAERDLGTLTEFYIPVEADGSVASVFEVYVQADPLQAVVSRVRTYVWLSVGSGVAFLAIFTIVLFVRNARMVIRQRREAERLLSDVVRASEAERRRVVGALHDDIGQPLYRIHYGIEDSRARVESGTEVDLELARVSSLVQEVDDRLRSELRALSDDPVAELNLPEAIAALAEIAEIETDLDISFEAEGDISVPSETRASLFRAAREGVTNARRHAQAKTMTVTLSRHGDEIVLEVVDDGVGFSGSPGLGLTTARDRLESVGGGLRVVSRPGEGTRFLAWVPDGQAGGGRA
jgi:two-component system, NarL family, sensor kinase